MNTLESCARRLAMAMLAGRFEVDAMLERTLPLVSGPRTWLKRLNSQVLKHFGNRRPRQKELVRFLQQSRGFQNASERDSFDIQVCSRRPEFLPSPGLFENAGVKRLRTVAELGDWLGLNESELLWFADHRQLERLSPSGPLRHYQYYWKRKRNGKCRLIEAPKYRMREIQRELLRSILNCIPVHDAAHGFRRDRSVRSHATPHIGRAVIVKLDLEDYFPSIVPARLTRILMHVGYTETVAQMLTSLCCNHIPHEILTSFPHIDDTNQRRRAELLYCRPHFPQGAPTSPAIANICSFRLDSRLAGLARSANAAYTRYADDLLFSGDDVFARSVDRFKTVVATIVMEEGLAVNHHKTRVMKRSVRQHAVGLVLNEKLNTRRDDFDRLKAILHRCILRGPAAVNSGQHTDFRGHLEGRIRYIAQSSESRLIKLNRLFEQIDWSEG